MRQCVRNLALGLARRLDSLDIHCGALRRDGRSPATRSGQTRPPFMTDQGRERGISEIAHSLIY